jgi:signal transduction histidine kinase
VTGSTAALPPAAALTVYRIVQEALTNVVKHAPGAAAAVQVRADPDGVLITVTDNGRPGPAPPVAGHGIVGMRERAAAFDGTLEAAPVPGTGFRVTAFLPVSATAAAGIHQVA